MILDALRVALVISVVSLAVFTAEYTRMTRWKCWTDPVGQSFLVAEVFMLGSWVPFLLAAFWHLSPFESKVGTWCVIGFMFTGGLAMLWRVLVFERVDRRARAAERAALAGGQLTLEKAQEQVMAALQAPSEADRRAAVREVLLRWASHGAPIGGGSA